MSGRLTPAQVRLLVSLLAGERRLVRGQDIATAGRLFEMGLVGTEHVVAWLTPRGRELAELYVPRTAVS